MPPIGRIEGGACAAARKTVKESVKAARLNFCHPLGIPRRTRVHIEGPPLYIVQRGHSRAACFFGDQDRLAYLGWLHEADHGASRGLALIAVRISGTLADAGVPDLREADRGQLVCHYPYRPPPVVAYATTPTRAQEFIIIHKNR